MKNKKKIVIMLLLTVLVIIVFLIYAQNDSARVVARANQRPDDIIDANGKRYQAVNLDDIDIYLKLQRASDDSQPGEYIDNLGKKYSIIEGPDGNLYKSELVIEDKKEGKIE